MLLHAARIEEYESVKQVLHVSSMIIVGHQSVFLGSDSLPVFLSGNSMRSSLMVYPHLVLGGGKAMLFYDEPMPLGACITIAGIKIGI